MPTHLVQTDIKQWIRKIADSKLSVPKYLAHHQVPFSQAQYYRYKKKMDQGGAESFKDRRTQGNNRRITAEIEGYLKGYVSGKPESSLSDIREVLKDRFHIDLSDAGISVETRTNIAGILELFPWR